MKTKKALLVLTCLLAVALTPMTAMAHGHGGGHHSSSVSTTTSTRYYRGCTIANCTKTGVHKHNGTYYCGNDNHTSGRHHH